MIEVVFQLCLEDVLLFVQGGGVWVEVRIKIQWLEQLGRVVKMCVSIECIVSIFRAWGIMFIEGGCDNGRGQFLRVLGFQVGKSEDFDVVEGYGLMNNLGECLVYGVESFRSVGGNVYMGCLGESWGFDIIQFVWYLVVFCQRLVMVVFLFL